MSGVQVHDDVKALYETMKVVRTCSDQSQRTRIAILKIVDGFITAIDVIRQFQLDADCVDPYELIKKYMCPDDCCYILYDCHYEKCDVYKEDLICMMWAPDGAKIKKKMCYASSRNVLSAAFKGIKFDLQVNDLSDLATRRAFACCLGLESDMTKLECQSMD